MLRSRRKAIVFECERFNDYIYGRNVVHVETDHKPLESIFKKGIHMAPKRLQRMRLRLQKYPLEVRYKRGSEMYVVDTLSRAYHTERKEILTMLSVKWTTRQRGCSATT